ncbi:hypothetical protein NQ317_005823 [Molorchus minor]|uniref:Tyr recombinase domain-containing protein n=1 Tax=Molorchus minor TaxID=1323400 RepID=A0ABQ9K0Y9_9CUCU|nr:hypothetical protein NQ317_005823 [Molorchus minor]
MIKWVGLTVDDIEDVGSSLIVKIPNTKTKIPRIFVVTDVGNMLELFRKYLSLRPPHVKHKRLFCTTKAGKCSSQPVGKNTMEKIPSVVASYLKLPDVACYTGHCLRRSSATLLADAGVDITTIKHSLVTSSGTPIHSDRLAYDAVLSPDRKSVLFLLQLCAETLQYPPCFFLIRPFY